MIRNLFAGLAAAALLGAHLVLGSGCGGEPDTGDTHDDLSREELFARNEPVWSYEGASSDNGSDEYDDADGAVEDKNYVPNGFGAYNGPNTQVRCPGPTHPLGNFCYVPHDKKVRFKYSGPNDVAEEVSAKLMFANAINYLCSDLNAAGWDCASTTGTSSEVVVIGPIPGTALGLAGQGSCNNSGDLVTHPGFGSDRKCHNCSITIDKDKIMIGRDGGHANVALVNTFQHEWLHCQALMHKNWTGNLMNPTLQSDSNVLRIDTPDWELYQNYTP
jgi:hypothetical protein